MDIREERADLFSVEHASPRTEAVITVSTLVNATRVLIERHLGLAWIGGEVSGLTRAASGHCYFTLKDERAQVRCVMYRQKAALQHIALRDGMAVEVRATPTLYEPRGEFQLAVESVRLAGVGALYEQFARLKVRLEAAGWFAASRKRALPSFPRSVGVVSSPSGAALRDVLTTLRRRNPALRVVLYGCAVQGRAAAAEIAGAVAIANARAEVDVLIVCRGGGSIEDLWAFNEEVVARAVLESAIPVVSGVGHETDFTICDFVADLRAATPTAAASAVAPDVGVLRAQVAALQARARRSLSRLLEVRMQRVDHASARLTHPAARIAAQQRAIADFARRLSRCAAHAARSRQRELRQAGRRLARQLALPLPHALAVERSAERLRRSATAQLHGVARRIGAVESGLRHLSPQRVLERGYSIVATEDGSIVDDARRLAAGDAVRLTFARGSAGATVNETRED
jgi:exodeoxyribonuclease VII large subunit